MDAHRAQQVDLLGYSFGAELAVRFASAAPHRTARVVAGGVRARGLFTAQAVSDIHRHLQTGAEFDDPLVAEAWAPETRLNDQLRSQPGVIAHYL